MTQPAPVHRTMSADTVDYQRYDDIQLQQSHLLAEAGNRVRPGSPLYRQQQRGVGARAQSMSPPRGVRGLQPYPEETQQRERSASQLRAAQQALISEGHQQPHQQQYTQHQQQQHRQNHFSSSSSVTSHGTSRTDGGHHSLLSRSHKPASTGMLPIHPYSQQQSDAQSTSTSSVRVRRSSFSNGSSTASSNLTVANMMTNPFVSGNTVTARQLQEYYNVAV